MDNEGTPKSPSTFYRSQRPEYFSDSTNTYTVELPKEVLAYELSKISTNQKQDQFETLCRRLVEKLIVPNLIPQVGPTGGGDGKTDSETYPVSEFIADRWFIPENGWKKDENWAFAFSAKERWMDKIKSDVKKIVETNRGYTKIYFLTNQLVSAKQKKDVQDKLTAQYKLPVIIFDGAWILDNIYRNDLIELVVDSLALSDVFKNKLNRMGSNDADRISRLELLEKDIANPNRYFEYDFQLIEDALQAAILSRMLEKPRDEVMGRFERALRFCGKIKNKRQLVRIYYQRAWTYINWYDDYPHFVEDFNTLKVLITQDKVIAEVELYINLYTFLYAISVSGLYKPEDSGVNLDIEQKNLFALLDVLADDRQAPGKGLIAQSFRSIEKVKLGLIKNEDISAYLKDLSQQIDSGAMSLEYPFEQFEALIENLGSVLPDHKDYDDLIDIVARVSGKRHSDREAGVIFLKRGGQKLKADYYKESIVYFGKAVLKLAREEDRYEMCLALQGLGDAYAQMDLLWAANNCYVTACSLSLKSVGEKGIIDHRTLRYVRRLVENELCIGRIPHFLLWRELLYVLKANVNEREYTVDAEEKDDLNNGCLAVRLLNTETGLEFSTLPAIFERFNLTLAWNACLYKLGYLELLQQTNNGVLDATEQALDNFFTCLADQPFTEQMLYPTTFINGASNSFSALILGCELVIQFEKDIELMIAAEAILAYFESFLATSLEGVIPLSEKIYITLIRDKSEQYIRFVAKEQSHRYELIINEFGFFKNAINAARDKFFEFVVHLLMRNFMFENGDKHFERLFYDEEVAERQSFIWGYRNFLIKIHGATPKITLNSWIDAGDRLYPNQRISPVVVNKPPKRQKTKDTAGVGFDQISHAERKVYAVTDHFLWSIAKWSMFGSAIFRDHLGILLGFKDGEAAIKIFEDWEVRFGKEDKDEVIRISIIKGFNRKNPFWYRIHICSNAEQVSSHAGHLVYHLSQLHEMWPQNANTMNLLVNNYEKFKSYVLYPAMASAPGKVTPYFNKGIKKKELVFRWAWEIGEHDIDAPAIKATDDPFIPDDVDQAPVANLLKVKQVKANKKG